MRKVLLAAIVAAALMPASAFGFGYGVGGGVQTAPGQAQALVKCDANFDFHEANVAPTPKGAKGGYPGQENCDHYFQGEGIIGGGSN